MVDSRTEFSWRATFINGPAHGSPDRVFTVGPPWRTIRLALLRPATVGWTIVGGDGIGDTPGGEPWPSEVTYRLVRLGHVDDAGDRVVEYGVVTQGPSAEDVYPHRPGERNRYWGD